MSFFSQVFKFLTTNDFLSWHKYHACLPNFHMLWLPIYNCHSFQHCMWLYGNKYLLYKVTNHNHEKKKKDYTHTTLQRCKAQIKTTYKSHKTEFIFLRFPSYQTEIINKIKKKKKKWERNYWEVLSAAAKSRLRKST